MHLEAFSCLSLFHDLLLLFLKIVSFSVGFSVDAGTYTEFLQKTLRNAELAPMNAFKKVYNYYDVFLTITKLCIYRFREMILCLYSCLRKGYGRSVFQNLSNRKSLWICLIVRRLGKMFRVLHYRCHIQDTLKRWRIAVTLGYCNNFW